MPLSFIVLWHIYRKIGGNGPKRYRFFLVVHGFKKFGNHWCELSSGKLTIYVNFVVLDLGFGINADRVKLSDPKSSIYNSVLITG